MFDPLNFIYVNGNTQRLLFILGEIPTEFYLFSENTHHAQNTFSEQTTTHKKNNTN